MNEIITWAAQHNTIVIQVVFSIVLLLVLVYVYRLFFVNSAAAGSGDTSAEFTEVNQKLDQLLEQQKSSGIQVIEKVVPAPVEATATKSDETTGTASSAELDQANAENAKLKAQLNELEKKVFELTPAAGADSGSGEDSKANAEKMAALNKKVEELQSRLSEYDIIADDIAELSQLRADNAELKKKLENSGGGSSGGSGGGGAEQVSASTAPVAEPAAVTEPAATALAPSDADAEMAAMLAEPAAEPAAAVKASPAETAPVESVASGEPPGFDAETSALLESLAKEVDALGTSGPAPVAAEPVAHESAKSETTEEEPKINMDQNIPENEKNLINEFEKSIQKGS